MGIIRFVDTGTPIGSGTAVNVGDFVSTVQQTACSPCDQLIQDELVCSTDDFWNNNLCGNDKCYTNPVVPGDCLNFQLQFQDTRNAKNAISYQQFLQRPNPKIGFNWYHNTLNPTNWTIKAKMWDACTGQEYKSGAVNYADIFMANAGIFLSQDRKASAKTLPKNSFYRWTQNIRFCIPTTLPNGFPAQFYFTFEVRNFANTASTTVYSQVFGIENCQSTIYLQGQYNLKDCFGYDYSLPPENINQPKPSPLLQVLASSFLYSGQNRNRAYTNGHRFRGSAQYTGRLIEKDIPERQCLSIKTSVREQYRVRTEPLPPYIAEIFNNNLSGKVATLWGVPGYDGIDVQPNSGATKENEISNMWPIDITMNGCECLDYHQC